MTSSLDIFIEIWNKLSYKHGDKAISLEDLISIWLDELEYNGEDKQDIIQCIRSFQNNNEILKKTGDTYRSLLLSTNSALQLLEKLPPIRNIAEIILKGISDSEFENNSQKTIENLKMNNSTKILLLIAFVFACIGIVIHMLGRKKRANAPGRGKNDTHQNHPLQIILFIAIYANSAEKEGIIEELKQKNMSQRVVKFLSSTANIKTLWQGEKNDYQSLGISEGWNCPSSVEDKYDVYLVEIELDKPELEFTAGSLAASYPRAFKRIADQNLSIEVSSRLPKESVSNPSLKKLQ